MTSPAIFNPENADFPIDFAEDFREARNSFRVVRFGPVNGKQVFDVASVTDAATGLEFPVEAWRLDDGGTDGDEHRSVIVRFDGVDFTKRLRAETTEDNFLARLKEGLKDVVQRKLAPNGWLNGAPLDEILAIYDGLLATFRGNYEPLLSALTSGTALAIEVHYTDAAANVDECEDHKGGGDNQRPHSATLLVMPRPRISASERRASGQ